MSELVGQLLLAFELAEDVIDVVGVHGGLDNVGTLRGLMCKCIGRLTLVMIWTRIDR